MPRRRSRRLRSRVAAGAPTRRLFSACAAVARVSWPRTSAPPEGIVVALEMRGRAWSALEKLAEQTAELHRQFLEGQAKTQQSFLKLLEHEQRLSWALLGEQGEATRLPVVADVRPARREPRHPEIAGGPLGSNWTSPAPPSHEWIRAGPACRFALGCSRSPRKSYPGRALRRRFRSRTARLLRS